MNSDPYRRISRVYDRVIEPVNGSLRALGRRMHEPPPGGAILDIGCGTGAHLEVYADTDSTLYGVDLSPSMLDRGRTRLGDRASLQIHDARDLPFEDATFDLVIASLVLHEVDGPAASEMLGEARRTLKPAGRFLVIDFGIGPLTGKGRVVRMITHGVERLAGSDHYRGFREFLGSGGLPAMAAAGGFVIEQERVVSGGNMHLAILVPS